LLDLAVNEAGDVMFDHDDEMIGGLRDELPVEQPRKPVSEVLPPMPEDIPVPAQDVEAGDSGTQAQRKQDVFSSSHQRSANITHPRYPLF